MINTEQKVPFTIKLSKDIKNLISEYCKSQGYIISGFVEKALKRQLEEEAETQWAMNIISERINEETLIEKDLWKEVKKHKKN